MFLSIPVDGRVARGLLRPLGFTLLGVVVRELLVAMEALVVTDGDGVTWILVDEVRLASSDLDFILCYNENIKKSVILKHDLNSQVKIKLFRKTFDNKI